MGETSARVLVPTGAATRVLGVHPETLRRWQREGKIEAERTQSGRWHYDVAGYLAAKTKADPGKGA